MPSGSSAPACSTTPRGWRRSGPGSRCCGCSGGSWDPWAWRSSPAGWRGWRCGAWFPVPRGRRRKRWRRPWAGMGLAGGAGRSRRGRRPEAWRSRWRWRPCGRRPARRCSWALPACAGCCTGWPTPGGRTEAAGVNPRALAGLACRVTAIILAIKGLEVFAIYAAAPWLAGGQGGPDGPAWPYLLDAFGCGALALLLFRAGPALMAFLFPPEAEEGSIPEGRTLLTAGLAVVGAVGFLRGGAGLLELAVVNNL